MPPFSEMDFPLRKEGAKAELYNLSGISLKGITRQWLVPIVHKQLTD